MLLTLQCCGQDTEGLYEAIGKTIARTEVTNFTPDTNYTIYCFSHQKKRCIILWAFSGLCWVEIQYLSWFDILKLLYTAIYLDRFPVKVNHRQVGTAFWDIVCQSTIVEKGIFILFFLKPGEL